MPGDAPLNEIRRFFGPNGLLSKTVPGYEDRPGQMQMAEAVATALAGDGTLLAEAPTGTGKTLAYLIPALLYDRRVVVATGTKNLQEQIIRKDWPFLRDRLGFDARVVLMKGRANYLCKHRWRLFCDAPRFRTREEATQFRRFAEWVATSDTGDRAEVDWISEDDPFWLDVTSTRHNCPGGVCTKETDCFVQKMRRRAASADVVIANHHLFFADLALKEDGHGEVIPDYHAVIFDEAHGLEDVATGFFASRLSSFMVDELDRDVVAAVSRIAPTESRHVAALRALRTGADQFFGAFPRGQDEKLRLRPGASDALFAHWPQVEENLRRLAGLLARLGRDLESPELAALADRANETLAEGAVVANLEDEEFVHYVEVRGRGVHVVAEPIEPANRVREALFKEACAVIFTSATLATDRDFRFFRSRMGIDFEAAELVLPTCFDYQTQTALYIPREFPEPASSAFMDSYIAQIGELVAATRGRALLLFTSYRNMERAYEAMADKLPYVTMMQGQGSKAALLERFRDDTHSVLFATQSFWEGVDVAGEALSCVVIDKLPFASPGEPLLEARIERIKSKGGNAFRDYQVPQAIISLKQGLGRLIRRRTDKGLLALTDVRVRSKNYGGRILKSLPDFPVTGDFEQVLGYASRLPAASETDEVAEAE
ncbi:MAG: ATP-dependent DNA helicase [Deltaproteobacteria bacterium]|nr:ATP-dependent DNA helicase [Deltaproteobacteria bacterium]